MSTNIKIQRICEWCGNEFTAKTTKTRFCSHLCNSRSYKADLRKKRIEMSNAETKLAISKPIQELKAKEFLSVREAAKLIGCSRPTIYSLINSGKIKSVNLKLKKTVIKRCEIDKLFA